jgi:hypothetical protein
MVPVIPTLQTLRQEDCMATYWDPVSKKKKKKKKSKDGKFYNVCTLLWVFLKLGINKGRVLLEGPSERVCS